MKRSILFAALAAVILSGCSSKNDPTQSHEVTFTVSGFQVETQSMSAPMREQTNPLTDDDGVQMTQLMLFDGGQLIAQQTNEDANFGTLTVMLTTGEHHLHFVATRSTDVTLDGNGRIACNSLRPTFGKHYDIDVTGSSSQNLNLDRITGQVIFTIEDEIPTGAASLRIQMNEYYKAFSPMTFDAALSGSFDQTITLSSSVGQSNKTWTLNILSPTYGEAHTVTFTLTARNTGGDIIGQATGTMQIKSNTKTLVHGNLFSGTESLVSLNTSWGADNDVAF